MKANKHLIRMVLLVLALTGAFLWVSHMVQEMHDFDDDLNETFLDYQAHPDEYIECEAEIVEHIPYEGLWTATDRTQCVVIFTPYTGKAIKTGVLEDYGKDEVGDIIRIVYHDNKKQLENGYAIAAQTKYIENTRIFRKLHIAEAVIVLLAVLVVALHLPKMLKS